MFIVHRKAAASDVDLVLPDIRGREDLRSPAAASREDVRDSNRSVKLLAVPTTLDDRARARPPHLRPTPAVRPATE